MTPADRFALDLGNLLSRHDLTGREFVAVCLQIAEAHFAADDLPPMLDTRWLDALGESPPRH